jgi:hypothetical protein
MSWQGMILDDKDQWYELEHYYFATEREAFAYAQYTASTLTDVVRVEAVVSAYPVNYTWQNGAAKPFVERSSERKESASDWWPALLLWVLIVGGGGGWWANRSPDADRTKLQQHHYCGLQYSESKMSDCMGAAGYELDMDACKSLMNSKKYKYIAEHQADCFVKPWWWRRIFQ